MSAGLSGGCKRGEAAVSEAKAVFQHVDFFILLRRFPQANLSLTGKGREKTVSDLSRCISFFVLYLYDTTYMPIRKYFVLYRFSPHHFALSGTLVFCPLGCYHWVRENMEDKTMCEETMKIEELNEENAAKKNATKTTEVK